MSQEHKEPEQRISLDQPEIAKAIEELELDDALEAAESSVPDAVAVAAAKGERAEISAQTAARIHQDQTQVKYASWILLIAAGWHFTTGVTSLAEGAGLSRGAGALDLLLAMLFVWAAWGGRNADLQAFRVGLMGLVGAALLSALRGRFWGVGIDGVAWGVVWLGRMALERVLEHAESKKPIDPKVECYHHLVPILVRLMTAEGDVDRRELQRIKEICDPVDITAYEHDYLAHRAQREQEYTLKDLVKGYLKAAAKVAGLHPRHSLLAASLAVVEADGVIASEEVRVLREISDLLGYSPEQFEMILRQMQTRIDQMDLSRAAHLLGVNEDATRTEIEHAHHRLLQDFLGVHHGAAFGEKIESILQKRRDILEQAYMMMIERLPPHPQTPERSGV